MDIVALIFSAFALGFSAVAMLTSPRAVGLLQGGAGLDESDLDYRLEADFCRDDKVEMAVLKSEVADLKGEIVDCADEVRSLVMKVNGHASQLGGAGHQLIKLQERVTDLEMIKRLQDLAATKPKKPTKPVKRATRKREKTA